MGRGPFAPAANGLVKIGETMTLVITVEGDPGFDIQVRHIHYVQESRLYSVLNVSMSYEILKITLTAIITFCLK
jgi:hypothetical protein